jgi:hypothetical protein
MSTSRGIEGRDMAEVTDAGGAKWSVYRRWAFRCRHASDSAGGGELGALVVDLLQIVVFSPFWLIAKGFGVPWTIVVERNGTEVREVRVSGLRDSQRCIEELAESAAAGTLERGDRRGFAHGGDSAAGLDRGARYWA